MDSIIKTAAHTLALSSDRHGDLPWTKESRKPLVYSSFPRRRESSIVKKIDSRLRENDKRQTIGSLPGANQCGGALVEYSLLLLAIMFILLIPVGPDKKDPSIIGELITALKNAYSGFSYAISLSFEGLL